MGFCAKAVRKNQNGICCDGCNLWHHVQCIDMSIETFHELGNSANRDWFCQKCTLAQFSDSFFTNPGNNSFEMLDSDSDSGSLQDSDSVSGSLQDAEKVYIRELHHIKCKHRKTLTFAHININSFRNKYVVLQDILYEKLADILVISETKLDASFPNAQFHVEGYKLYRKDRDSNGGGVIIYIRSDLTSRQRTDLETDQIECISVEILLGNTKWLVMGMYKPPSMKPDTFSTDLQKYLDKVHISIENLILLGDLNYDLSDPTKGKTLRDICDIFNLQNLIK